MNHPNFVLQQQPINRSFTFNRRNEKIDWRRIAAIDVERVARDLDFQVLQDNIQHIALCNIDMEIDTRAIDPNFTKLYKISQLIIEYLLLCQDQISNQLVDYEKLKSQNLSTNDEFQRELLKLKNELNTTKKESKRRKKVIEQQQKLLLTQQPAHHRCPICAHSFVTFDYLQAHIHRRHPEHDANRNREHDVDVEKENQRLKEEVRTRENDLQLIRVQKAVDEEKIRKHEENIQELKNENQQLKSKITILEEKCFTLRSSTQIRTPSPHRSDPGIKELTKENKSLRKENEQLKQSLEHETIGKSKIQKRLERENKKLQKQIDDLNKNLELLQNSSGVSEQLTHELNKVRSKYNEEKTLRTNLQKELDQAREQLNQLQRQPAPPVIHRESPVPPPRITETPSPQPIGNKFDGSTKILLPQYCPRLIREVNQNENILNTYRNSTRRQLNDELQQHEDLRIVETDTRVKSNEFPTKMNMIGETRTNIQRDLPNFERIRNEISQTLDTLVQERLSSGKKGPSSIRATGGKLVSFRDTEKSDHQYATPSKTKHQHMNPSTNFHSDDEKTNTFTKEDDSDSDDSATSPVNPIQPPPRKTVPPGGITTSILTNIRPSSAATPKTTVSALVQPISKEKIHGVSSDSDSDENNENTQSSPVQKAGFITVKPVNPNLKGQMTTTKNIPSYHSTSKHLEDDDNDSDPSLTTINDTNPRRTSFQTNQDINSARGTDKQNNFMSSGDFSLNTYDTSMISPNGKGHDYRRPTTADSAITSHVDSESDVDEIK